MIYMIKRDSNLIEFGNPFSKGINTTKLQNYAAFTGGVVLTLTMVIELIASWRKKGNYKKTEEIRNDVLENGLNSVSILQDATQIWYNGNGEKIYKSFLYKMGVTDFENIEDMNVRNFASMMNEINYNIYQCKYDKFMHILNTQFKDTIEQLSRDKPSYSSDLRKLYLLETNLFKNYSAYISSQIEQICRYIRIHPRDVKNIFDADGINIRDFVVKY